MRVTETRDEMTLELNSPLTEEDWDLIEDVDFEHTDRIWFTTKHGKRVEFVKATQLELYGYDIKQLELIARVLQKENLPPERAAEALSDIGRIVAIIKDEFAETLRKTVMQATQPERKKGEWINKKPRWIGSLSMTVQDAYECSNCGEAGVNWWMYCIYCGAPMEIEEWRKPIIERWRSEEIITDGNTRYIQDPDGQGWSPLED